MPCNLSADQPAKGHRSGSPPVSPRSPPGVWATQEPALPRATSASAAGGGSCCCAYGPLPRTTVPPGRGSLLLLHAAAPQSGVQGCPSLSGSPGSMGSRAATAPALAARRKLPFMGSACVSSTFLHNACCPGPPPSPGTPPRPPLQQRGSSSPAQPSHVAGRPVVEAGRPHPAARWAASLLLSALPFFALLQLTAATLRVTADCTFPTVSQYRGWMHAGQQHSKGRAAI